MIGLSLPLTDDLRAGLPLKPPWQVGQPPNCNTESNTCCGPGTQKQQCAQLRHTRHFLRLVGEFPHNVGDFHSDDLKPMPGETCRAWRLPLWALSGVAPNSNHIRWVIRYGCVPCPPETSYRCPRMQSASPVRALPSLLRVCPDAQASTMKHAETRSMATKTPAPRCGSGHPSPGGSFWWPSALQWQASHKSDPSLSQKAAANGLWPICPSCLPQCPANGKLKPLPRHLQLSLAYRHWQGTSTHRHRVGVS